MLSAAAMLRPTRLGAPMPAMAGCGAVTALCANGSAVEACNLPAALKRMPSAEQARSAARDVCTSMPKMADCASCTPAACADPLLSLARLCGAMPGPYVLARLEFV